ncbi:MAG: adenylosuccinate synthetase [Bacteroidota bacterium]
MTAQIVIGLGFGDEGKGMLTDYLCRKAERPLVVRFSGGHQAGHTVASPDGRLHVFSNFGAGTLASAPTFWSRYCTFHPIGYANELAALEAMGLSPKLYVDGLAPVTTPFDLLYNRAREERDRHGSCGLGFGATIARHEGPHKVHVMDLLDDFVLAKKLKSVFLYYDAKLRIKFNELELNRWMNDFREALKVVRSKLHISSERAFFQTRSSEFSHLIFEGSQGILLDQEFGYFPHVTRAYTSSRNALELLDRIRKSIPKNPSKELAREALIKAEVHYITRAYQTRHGNGPLSQELKSGLDLKPTPYETNQTNDWQGPQRRSLLDLDQLRYAVQCDAHYSAGLDRYLTVSCMDQIKGPWLVMEKDQPIVVGEVKNLGKRIGGDWAGVFANFSQEGNPQRDGMRKKNLAMV